MAFEALVGAILDVLLFGEVISAPHDHIVPKSVWDGALYLETSWEDMTDLLYRVCEGGGVQKLSSMFSSSAGERRRLSSLGKAHKVDRGVDHGEN